MNTAPTSCRAQDGVVTEWMGVEMNNETVAEALRWKRRAMAYEQAIRETLEDNGHLADGENCTLIKLKRVLSAKIPSSELLAACNKLLNYWHSNLYNFQLEKAEDYFRMIEQAVNGKDGGLA